jgi:dynein heavy chain
MLSKIASNLD